MVVNIIAQSFQSLFSFFFVKIQSLCWQRVDYRDILQDPEIDVKQWAETSDGADCPSDSFASLRPDV